MREVVLHEGVGDSGLGVVRVAPRFEKIAARASRKIRGSITRTPGNRVSLIFMAAFRSVRKFSNTTRIILETRRAGKTVVCSPRRRWATVQSQSRTWASRVSWRSVGSAVRIVFLRQEVRTADPTGFWSL